MTPRISGYRVETTLGTGGMASVYRATQESLGRPVALKVLTPAMAREADFARRFVQEGRTVAAFVHPHIVTVHEAGDCCEFHYMAMELLPGGSLAEHLDGGRGPGPERALHITRCMAGALAYAHQQGIVHRDVKPANILFRQDGTPVLTDFGVARRLDEITYLTRQGLVVGSPGYMSPEQIQGEPADARSDLYSLGIVIYQMLVGQAPYRVPTRDPFATAQLQLTQPPPRLPSEHRRFQPLLERLLAKAPGDRLRSAAELLAELDLVGATAPDATVVRPPARGMGAPGPMPRSRPSLWWVGTGATVLLLAGVAIYLPKPKPPGAAPSEVAEDRRQNAGAVEPTGQPARQRLLDEARAAVEAGRLIQPSGDSAFHRYQRILARWPGDRPALGGMAQLHEQVRQRARALLSSGDPGAALTATDLALRLWPDSGGLRDLRSEAQRALETRRVQAAAAARQAQLLARAEEQLAARRLTRPPGNNALETYRELLRLAPGNAQARAGLGRISDAYLALAREAAARGRPATARRMAERGLQVTPGHPGLTQWLADSAASAASTLAADDLRARQPLGRWLDQDDLALGLRPLGTNRDAARLQAGDAFVLVLRSRSAEGYLTVFNIYQDGRVAPLAGNEPMAPVMELPSPEQQARGLVITAGLLEADQPTLDLYLALRSDQPLDTRALRRAVSASPGRELALDDFLDWARAQPVRAAALAQVTIDP